MRMQVRSLASLSGLRIWRCRELRCGSQTKLRSDVATGYGVGPNLQHTEVPRLGTELELQLPARARATATAGQSHVCDLHHSSGQRQILNPLSEARGRTCVLMDTSWVHYH